MEKVDKPIVFKAKVRGRTVRIIRVNRVVAFILLITIAVCSVIVYFAVKSNNALKIDSRRYYYLQMGEFTSAADAMAKSIELKKSGASGYIINDGIFRVMATVFNSKKDAEVVENKLMLSGKQCKIYEIKTAKLKLGKYDSAAENKIVRELLLYPGGLFFGELQKQDISLDAGETTDSATMLAVSNLKKELTGNYEKIVSYLSKYPTDKMLNTMEKIYKEILQSFKNYLPDTELTAGTNIKSILCLTIEVYIKYTAI